MRRAKQFNEILMLSLAIAMTIISSTIYMELQTEETVLTQVSHDWKTHPIVDVKVLKYHFEDKNMTCPEGYDTLFKREWPGTVQGCSCVNIFGMNVTSDH